MANGIIVDPAGIGVSGTSSDSSSSSNGDSLSDQISDMINDLNISCFITTAALQPSDAEQKSLWSEIRGRELAIIFIALVLIYAGRLVIYRIRHMWTHIRHRT
jgi:hypothetical protein